MSILIILISLSLLIFAAYRGFSVILFAPVAALLAVLLTQPYLALPVYSWVFGEKMVSFIKLFFPVFLLSAVFGKLTEASGMAGSIARTVIKLFGAGNAMPAIVVLGAILTYGGVSLFVVAFAVYPFAADLFKSANIPKRLIPATIALGAFTFTMDAFPGSPQIQNIIPTSAFHTTTWAAPWLGFLGGLFIFICGTIYLQWQKRKAAYRKEGYGINHINEPEIFSGEQLPNIWVSILPLLIVVACNKLFNTFLDRHYGKTFSFPAFGIEGGSGLDLRPFIPIWSVSAALVLGIVVILLLRFRRLKSTFKKEMNISIGGALLAAMNTASEYGFGAVIAVLPGFKIIEKGMASVFGNVLVNEAVAVTTLSGITGSASGGMSIALASMKDIFLSKAMAQGIPNEVLHRVASMASGGMDTLPHNSSVLTLLVITGLTHRQSYKDIFMLTLLKVVAVFFIILLYYSFGVV
ncbi:MAG TPA: GntP family permease [Puia sp.]|jgi:H+/gluconate symporter-like permease